MNRLTTHICAVVGLLGMAVMAHAQATGTGTAAVNCIVAITIAETTTTDWGKVALPSDGTTDYTLNYSTGATTLSASTATGFTGHAYSDGHNGVWAVTGDPNAPFSYTFSIGAFSGTGVTVQAAHINATSNSGADTLDGTGAFTLNTGGIIRVTAAAGTGAHTATATVVVNYT